jgi:hypothetical protein
MMKAAVFRPSRGLVFGEVPDDQVAADEVLVRVANGFCTSLDCLGLSNGVRFIKFLAHHYVLFTLYNTVIGGISPIIPPYFDFCRMRY